MADLTSLAARIAHARDLSQRPHALPFLEPAAIGSLPRRQTAHAPYLAFHDPAERAKPAPWQSHFDFFGGRVGSLYAALRDLGVRRGTRIVTAMHNHDRTIALYFAVWELGATIVPLNMNEDDRRLQHAISHSHAILLVAFDEYTPRARALARGSSIRYVVCAGSGESADPGDEALRQRLNPVRSSSAKTSDPQPDDEALIVYTSGTTGQPKGVILTQYNLAVDAWAVAQWHGFTPQTRLLCVLPIHHVNGIVVSHLAPLLAGASVVLLRKFSAHTFFQTVALYGVHIVSVVPTLLQFLLEATPKELDVRALCPTLTHFICGAGPLTVDLAARFEDRFGIPIVHGYGLSETTCYSCFLPAEGLTASHRDWMRSHGYPSIGRPLPVNEMAIHDEHGKPLGPGEKGEIVARGHNVTPGYFDNPAANAAAFTHGWFRSGDEGFFKNDAEGRPYFFISGRFKELIIRGGVKISPLEIDEVLAKIPGVKAAMAVGFENTTYGEEVGAYVVATEENPATAASVLAACRATLPAWMCPKVVVFGTTFPVTSTGKYQRNQLKPLFAGYREIQYK